MDLKPQERRLITIIFADLSGFTALSSQLDPEDVQEVANTTFEILNKPIIDQGGTVHKYEGDLVIALFGLPFAHEDDPERAIKAGLRMLELIPEVNECISKKLKKKTDLGLHIGINSGIVVAGEVGSEEKKEWTVMGDVVNLTSRLKDIAQRGEIIVSETVYRASRYLFEYEILDPVVVKGIEKPVRIFKPLRLKEKPEPKRGIHGISSPLVGRDEELALLQEWVKKIAKGEFGAGFILGDAGIGKSRLFMEFKKYLSSEVSTPFLLLETACLSFGDAIPFLPILQIIKQIFKISDADSLEVIQAKLLKKAQEFFRDEYGEVLPYLGYLFSIRFSEELEEKIKYLTPRDLKLQIFLSVCRLFARIARDQPVILAIDDFHWIDAESLELLDFIFSSPRPFPFFLLAILRLETELPGYRFIEKLKKRLPDIYLKIILKPLDIHASSQIIANLLKSPGFPQTLCDKLLKKAEGNPFYLEELIRSLIDGGYLVLEAGVWRMTADIQSIAIPDTLQALLTARLDRLSPELRKILQAAAVMGRNFYVRILEMLNGFEELMLTFHLATLEEMGYIRRLETESDLAYTFNHPLIQEVVYNSLVKKKRRELHRCVGAAIEQAFSHRLDDFTEILAYQYSQSDELKKALEWLKKAGKKAKDRYANEEAKGYFEKILSMIKEEQPPETDYQSVFIEALEALGDIYALKGEYEKAIKNYEEVFNVTDDTITKVMAQRKIAGVYQNQGSWDEALMVLGEELVKLTNNSPEGLMEKAEIHFSRATSLRIKGMMEEALKEIEEGLKITEKLSTTHLNPRLENIRAKGFNNWGTILYDKGKYDQAIEAYKKSLAIYERVGDKRGTGIAMNNLGNVYMDKGDYKDAIGAYQQALKIFEEIGDRRSLGIAHINLGIIYYKENAYDRAIAVYKKTREIFEEIGDKHGFAVTGSNLGLVYYDIGAYDQAREVYQQSLAIFERTGNQQGIGIVNNNLGMVNLKIDELKEAEGYLLNAKEVLELIGDKSTLIHTYCLLAQVLLRQGRDFEEVIGLVDKGYKFAEEINSKPEKANCYFTYGKIYAHYPDAHHSPKAKEYFLKAMQIYTELRQKKELAECYFEYACLLKNLEEQKSPVMITEGSATYFAKASALFKELGLIHRIEEVAKDFKPGSGAQKK